MTAVWVWRWGHVCMVLLSGTLQKIADKVLKVSRVQFLDGGLKMYDFLKQMRLGPESFQKGSVIQKYVCF